MLNQGIYKITNLKNGKVYIGQSTKIEYRWTQHKSERALRKNPNNLLYLDFVNNGVENFKFEILEKCRAGSLNKREKFYIDLYKSYHPEIGYNLTRGGSMKRSGRKARPVEKNFVRGDISESIYRGKVVYCVNDKKKFYTIKSAANFYNVDPGNICKILKGKRTHTKGLSFRYAVDL